MEFLNVSACSQRKESIIKQLFSVEGWRKTVLLYKLCTLQCFSLNIEKYWGLFKDYPSEISNPLLYSRLVCWCNFWVNVQCIWTGKPAVRCDAFSTADTAPNHPTISTPFHPEILKVLHSRQDLTPQLEVVIQQYPAENHGLRPQREMLNMIHQLVLVFW